MKYCIARRVDKSTVVMHEELHQIDLDTLEGPVEKVLSEFAKLMSSHVGSTKHTNVRIQLFEPPYEDGEKVYKIIGTREPTAKELKDFLKQEKVSDDIMKENRRRAYENLRAEFEGK